MAYATMLRRKCRILRKVETPGESGDNGWGYESGDRSVAFFPGGDWFDCWYTDAGGTEIVNVTGTDVRVTTNVDMTPEMGRQVQDTDRLELDDGRIVDVLNVRFMAGGFKARAQCGSKSGISAT